MTIKHLDHLNFTVTDLDASLDWYQRAFGFEPVEDGVQNGQRWAIVRSGESMLCLYEAPELADHSRGDEDAHRLAHFGLRITDRAAWEATVQTEGLEVRYGGAIHWPSSKSWYVVDPSGWEIEVVLWQEDRISFAA